ncbi:PAS domain-containing protein [Kineococcus xinjiangensis]|uniref:PAS domain-containing protein n=1 Tax=Kineococcus xinjiangensis TaxID=512762 RepID=A0A2S6IEL5_9ACTN|nr:PAS domain-containing protein [Kineococcus xinjiangensis]
MAGAGDVDFAAAFEATPTPSLILDRDAVIVAVNSAALRAVARTRSDLIGRSIFDTFPDNPEDPDALGSTNFKASLDRVLQTARPDTMALQKYDVPAPGGGFLRRWWSPVNIPLLDESGQVRWMLHRSEEVTSYVDERLQATTAVEADIEADADDDAVAGRAAEPVAGSALRTARADLQRAESDLYLRGQELGAALRTARRWAEQQAGLVDIAHSLGEAQDEDAVLKVIARHSTSLLGASGSGLCLREPDDAHVRFLITDTIAADVRAAVQLLPRDHPLPIVHTAATGEAHFHEDLAATVARFPEAEELYTAADTQASASAPLRGHGRLLGSLAMAFSQPRTWTQQDRDLVNAFAALITQALERLAARDGERAASATAARFSETLQRSMLTAPPQADYLQVVVRYAPAAAESQVGGDWYDAYRTPGGSTSLVIGDVAGHDQNAAATMGQLRNLLRGIDHATGEPPAGVLSALDRAAHDLGVNALATVILARVEQPAQHLAAGTRVLRWSNAGHPPPLLLQPGAAPRFLDAKIDLMVGIDPHTARTDHEVVLVPGATVLFYTDGLIERRDASLDEGLQWLAGAARELNHGTPEELVDGLLELVGLQVEDDVALLALYAHPEDALRPAEAGANLDPRHEPTLSSAGPADDAGPQTATVVDVRDVDDHCEREQDDLSDTVLLLDPDPAAVRQARTFVHDYCCHLQTSEDICDTLTLLVSEVVTNAISHGRSQARLQVSSTPSTMRVEVSDDDSRLPVLAPADPDALGGRGLAMVDLLASAWGVREEAIGKTVWVELHA